MIISGKDKGRSGRVEKVFPQTNTIVVPGINEYKKHRKPVSAAAGQERPGEIVTLVRPLAASKVAVVCPKCKLITRVGYRMDGDKKVRICRKCDNDLDEIKVQSAKIKTAKVTKVKSKK